MTILIVDDNDDFRRLVKSLVNEFGDEISECTDGSEAIEFCNKVMPDLILMDIQMKHIDGFTAAKEILAISDKTQIIILTQFDDTTLKMKAKQIGAYDYVIKDNLLQLNQLLENINKSSGE